MRKGRWAVHGEDLPGARRLLEHRGPVPCPDSRCGLLSYALVLNGELLPLGRMFAPDQMVDCLADLKD